MIQTFHKIRRKVIVWVLFRRKVEPQLWAPFTFSPITQCVFGHKTETPWKKWRNRDKKKAPVRAARLWLSRHVLTLTVWTKLELSAANEVSGLIRPYEKLGHGVRKGGKQEHSLVSSTLQGESLYSHCEDGFKTFYVTCPFPVSLSFFSLSVFNAHTEGHMWYTV